MSFTAVLERLQKLENPYPGLRPFETQESHLFFGRDQQIAELVGRLDRNRFVAVVGVSGSGKSSLVRAGLIPALERGSVGEAGSRWHMVVTRPAGAPYSSLAADLSKSGLDPSSLRQSSHGLVQVARQLPREETLLVVVDQFEELFRYKDREPVTEEARRARQTAASEASEFVQLLLAASRQQPPVYIVLTMRSDYLGDCAEFRDLPETLNDCQYLVPRLTREQRKQGIEGPLGSTAIAPSLVQLILNDAGDEPDQLPILQHALMRTWSHWRKSDPEQKRRIDVQDYEASGRFGNALNQHADELLEGVPDQIAETIFKRLTARGRRGHRERRDPATLAELWAVCGAETPEQQSQATAVIDHFRQGEATFLAPRDGALLPHMYIDITHESLIRQWKKLRDEWLPQESKSAKTFLYLLARAASWKAGKGEVLLGLDLTGGVEWNCQRNRTKAWANHYADEAALGTVLEFIVASQAQEQKREFRERRNLWIAVAAALLFAVLAGVAGYEWNQAKKVRINAQMLGSMDLARRLAAQSELLQTEGRTDLEPAALLATETMERLPSLEADRALRESLRLVPRQTARLFHGGPVYSVAFSADGRYVATASSDFTARVFEAASGKEVARLPNGSPVATVAFSADGRYVATGSADSMARVFETASGREVARLPHDGSIAAVVFSADSRYVATGSHDFTARVFKVASWKEVARLIHRGSVYAVAFSADGRYVATGSEDKTARVFEAASGKEVARLIHRGSVYAVAFSADGRHIATGSTDKTARVFEAASGKEVAHLTHDDLVLAVAFSADGRYVATGSEDKTARVFDAASGKEVARLIHKDRVGAVAFSADGRYVATGSYDTTARVFEAASGREVARLTHQGSVFAVAFGADGRYVATGSYDRTARVFEAPSAQAVAPLVHHGSVLAVAFSGDGRYVAIGSQDKTARVFEAASGKAVAPFIHHGSVYAVAFSADGRYVATGCGDKTARVFEAASGRAAAPVIHDFSVLAVAFSADGRYMATGSNRTARVFEAASGKEIARLTHDDPVYAVAFSADGRYVVTGSRDNTARVFEVASEQVVAHLIHQGAVYAVAFSTDGRYVATGSYDRTARVFEAASGKEIARLTHQGTVDAVAFSADGRYVATGSEDETARVFEAASGKEIARMVLDDPVKAIRYIAEERKLMTVSFGNKDTEMTLTTHLLRPREIIDEACSRIERNLTTDEWRQYVGPEVPYHKTCPNLP
jgi:uncharacterized delta-60 repeat protein